MHQCFIGFVLWSVWSWFMSGKEWSGIPGNWGLWHNTMLANNMNFKTLMNSIKTCAFINLILQRAYTHVRKNDASAHMHKDYNFALTSLPTWNRVDCRQKNKCHASPGDVAVIKRHQRLNKILTFFFTLHIWEISKLFYAKILHGVCCMKPSHAFITSVCWSHRIASIFSIAWESFLVNNFANFLDVVGIKKNQDFIWSMVAF